MKKIFSLLFITILTTGAKAQFLRLTLSMNARPTSTLSDWSYRQDVLTLAVVNQSPVGTMTAKLKTEIRLTDGTVVATTDLANAASFTFIQGTNTILNSGDVVNLSILQFTGSYQAKLNKTGKLPAGNYQLAVRFYRPDGTQPVSEEASKIFYLANLQLPVLMTPPDESSIKGEVAQTAILFRWTPVNPAPVTAARYRIQVFEVMPNQQPLQALRGNLPLLDQEVVGTTQYVWRPLMDMRMDSIRKFIWSIQVFDNNGVVMPSDNATGEARSEPKTFVIVNKPVGVKPVNKTN